MYEKLINELRFPCPHENCILCQQAADVIDELNKELMDLKTLTCGCRESPEEEKQMKDYIERDLMLKQAGHLPIPLSLDEVRLLRRVINSIPAADVRETVRGKWGECEGYDECYGDSYPCSVCGRIEIGKPNFCSNCGAYNGGGDQK